MNKDGINILFVGDIFGKPGIDFLEKKLPELKKEFNIDFVIAQSENASDRKGLEVYDYNHLSKIGINVFTMGNHVWAKKSIVEIIDNKNIIRPLNIDKSYPGHGTAIFDVKGFKLRVSSLLGITFNELLKPWKEERANSFFDSIDEIIENDEADFHIIDFHAETTSEKAVLGLYLDGKISALIGTHTHVQTNDDRVLPNGTLFISDVGMCGPFNSAIGANFQEVYEKMRFNSRVRFQASNNKSHLQAVVMKLRKNRKNEISKINIIE